MCTFCLKYTIWVRLHILVPYVYIPPLYNLYICWNVPDCVIGSTYRGLNYCTGLCCQHRVTHESTIRIAWVQCAINKECHVRALPDSRHSLQKCCQQSQRRQGLLALSPGSWASSSCCVQMLAAWQDSHASSLRQSTESSTQQQLWHKSAITCHWMQCQTNQPTNDCKCNHVTANQSSC